MLDLLVDIENPGLYRVTVDFTEAPDYGTLRVEIDGRPSPAQFNGYVPAVTRSGAVDLGAFQFGADAPKISFRIVGRDRQSRGYFVGISRLVLTPAGAP